METMSDTPDMSCKYTIHEVNGKLVRRPVNEVARRLCILAAEADLTERLMSMAESLGFIMDVVQTDDPRTPTTRPRRLPGS